MLDLVANWVMFLNEVLSDQSRVCGGADSLTVSQGSTDSAWSNSINIIIKIQIIMMLFVC